MMVRGGKCQNTQCIWRPVREQKQTILTIKNAYNGHMSIATLEQWKKVILPGDLMDQNVRVYLGEGCTVGRRQVRKGGTMWVLGNPGNWGKGGGCHMDISFTRRLTSWRTYSKMAACYSAWIAQEWFEEHDRELPRTLGTTVRLWICGMCSNKK